MASEQPLLVFPSFQRAKRDKGFSIGKLPHTPSKSEQIKRLGPQFKRLQQAFKAERLALQTDSQGLFPEFVLVIETRGRIEDFYRAAQAIGIGWLGEIDLDGLEPDDDFYIPDKNGQRTEKHLDGRLYLGMTDQRALEELLRLWGRFKEEQPLGQGNAKWRELFSHAKEIRRWGVKDRLIDYGILDDWAQSIEDDPSAPVTFRVELWYPEKPDNSSRQAHQQAEEDTVRQAIIAGGGEILANIRIDEIHFHAFKGQIPVSVARSAFRVLESEDETGLATLFRNNAIRTFLPIAQGIASLPSEGEPSIFFSKPLPNDKPPVVALLDGYPFSQHDVLNNRIDIYDPDILLSKYPHPKNMRHGTAMASLIVHGELDANEPPLSRRIFCQPILEPDLMSRNEDEHIPETVFAEDRVHKAIVEMFEGDKPTAPTIYIVNLSIGEQPFFREISPWARLIDWLAWKYKLLFLISSGNQGININLGLDESTFLANTDKKKIQTLLHHHQKNLFDRRLLSPSEAINALTIGAQHKDYSTISYLANRVDLLPSNNFPNPASRLGPGFRQAIKPEILLPGGRQLYRYCLTSNGAYSIDKNKIAPGQKTAAPDHTGTGLTNDCIYTRGTSNATALATRAAAKLYEVLEGMKNLPGGDCINRDTTAPLLKALIVHSATWPDEAIDVLKTVVPKGNKQKRGITRFLGYGVADPARVEACVAQRATVLGAGLLQQDEAHEYELPIPVELSNTTEWRRLIITLAWLTPVNPTHRVYRKAKLSFQPPKDLLAVDRQHADWQQVQKGTVQHEVLEGKKACVFQDGDSLRIKIAAQGDTSQNFDEAIPYGLAITLEVEDQSGIPIYERVREKLTVRIVASV
ncbi:MAG: S8 family peptidase [Candidatus Competibacteraceae bacterium]|nr:S8 family peptidase [Candidatus Competibacteraceae bacterium]